MTSNSAWGLGNRELFCAAEQADTGIVDKQVDAPGLGQHLGTSFATEASSVTSQVSMVTPSGFFRAGTTAGAEHPKARVLQGLGRCPSNTGGCPRDEGDTKIWFAQHSLLSIGIDRTDPR